MRPHLSWRQRPSGSYDLPAADFFSVESTFITPGMVQQIHLRGKTISAWTVNRQEDASDLLSLGVDDIITDKPEMVQQLMNADADLDNDLLFIRDTIRGSDRRPRRAAGCGMIRQRKTGCSFSAVMLYLMQ